MKTTIENDRDVGMALLSTITMPLVSSVASANISDGYIGSVRK